MLIAVAALMLLVVSGEQRISPDVPTAPAPWMERGNRRARRRDKKLARVR